MEKDRKCHMHETRTNVMKKGTLRIKKTANRILESNSRNQIL